LSQALQRGALSRREVLRLALGAGAFALLPGAIRAQSRSRFVDYPFQLGVASGYPTAMDSRLWTRLAPSPLADDGGMGADEQIEVHLGSGRGLCISAPWCVRAR
jgi:alkaline phosphatase D